MKHNLHATLLLAFSLVLVYCKKEYTENLNTNYQDNLLSHKAKSSNFSNEKALVVSSYTFTKEFDILSTENQQGLAFGKGFHFATFDIYNGKGRIVQYSSTGAVVKKSTGLAIGHAAEASYRQANGRLYIANGGLAGHPTMVYEVDMNSATPAITRTIDFSSLGANGMVAVDNSNGRLIVFAGANNSPYTIATADFNGKILSKFSISEPYELPQGIEIIGNEILYYSSKKDRTSNTITVYSINGTKLYTIPVPIAAEGEGLSIDEATNTVFIGTHYPNRVYRVNPAFVSRAQLGMNLILNPNAEGGAGVTMASVPTNIPFWTATTATVLQYRTGSLPSATSPGSPNRQLNYFAGATTESGKLKQQINVSNLSADINAGAIYYTLKGWLGGYYYQNDNAKVTATFLSGSGVPLGSTTIGPVLAAERNNITGMIQKYNKGMVPKGTSSISVVITITRVVGTNCDGYADDLSLVLTKL